ncbi:hypothetical protein H4219_001144 [Mycoemilia scoparia]|uniref:Uncharacterized protein n=1 Tax=Mycoemilia scoparia TaxID=417184 RepID=A0A9W8A922_9FUNG|nr:hypothetical protein H4219_001144 [Mycoemilia scoparia]
MDQYPLEIPGVQKSSLRFLSLRLNKVSEHHSHVLKSLLEGDSGCKLEALDLSQNLLRLAMPSICLALSSNTHLKELSLTKNNLSSDSLVNIAKCLPKNRSLTSLDLSNNPLTYYGMDGLNELKIELPSNKFLQCLFMSDTKLTTEGAIILAEGLPDLRHLQRLDISLNPGIDTAGILALSASMKSNRSLLCLEVTIDSSDELANLFEQEIVKACIENMERPNHPPNYDSDSDSKSNDSLTSGNNRIKTNTTTIREKNCTNPRKLIPTPSFVSIHHSSSCSTHSSSSLGPMIKKKESHSSFDSIVKARNSLEVHGTNSDIKHRHSHDGIAIPSIQVRGSEITCARRSSFEGTASPVLLASSSPRSQHMIVFHDDIGYTSQTPEYHENLFELRKKADKDEGQTLRQISAEPNVSIKPISNDSQAGIGQAVTTSRLKIEGRRHEPNELDLQSAPAKPGFSDDNSNRSKSPNIQHTDQV